MVTTLVIDSRITRVQATVRAAAATVVGLTAVGVVVALADPTLAGTTAPHPALTGTVGDAAWILQNNARTLAAPFLLAAVGFPRSRLGRRAGDLTVAALAAASTVPVGLELGRWQTRLLPYLPQLPLEWAALTLAVHAWLTARNQPITIRQLAPLAAVTLVLLVGAAGLETWATPHRRTPRSARTPIGVTACEAVSRWGSVVVLAADCAPPRGIPLQGRVLPFPRVARFRSALMAALTGLHQPPPTPTRRGSF